MKNKRIDGPITLRDCVKEVKHLVGLMDDWVCSEPLPLRKELQPCCTWMLARISEGTFFFEVGTTDLKMHHHGPTVHICPACLCPPNWRNR